MYRLGVSEITALSGPVKWLTSCSRYSRWRHRSRAFLWWRSFLQKYCHISTKLHQDQSFSLEFEYVFQNPIGWLQCKMMVTDQGCKRDVARRDRVKTETPIPQDKTETFKKHVSRRPRPRRSRHETDTLTEMFKLKVLLLLSLHGW